MKSTPIRRAASSRLAATLFVLISVAALSSGRADVHPVAPAYSSLPGAPYTLYLDFGGFNFSGTWANNGYSMPGVTPAYDRDGNPNVFNSMDLTAIRDIFNRVAEKYATLDVNVTTVDPAVAAGQAGTDAQRLAYYDSQPRMMHTVIGGGGAWNGGGGVSYVGVTPNNASGSNGLHTNFVFSAESPTNYQFVAEATAHENGHGLGLLHQHDFNGTTLVNEYSYGDSELRTDHGRLVRHGPRTMEGRHLRQRRQPRHAERHASAGRQPRPQRLHQ